MDSELAYQITHAWETRRNEDAKSETYLDLDLYAKLLSKGNLEFSKGLRDTKWKYVEKERGREARGPRKWMRPTKGPKEIKPKP